jgi:hypothetical protein
MGMGSDLVWEVAFLGLVFFYSWVLTVEMGRGGRRREGRTKKGGTKKRKEEKRRKGIWGFGMDGLCLSVSDGWWKKEGRNLSVWPCGAFLGVHLIYSFSFSYPVGRPVSV